MDAIAIVLLAGIMFSNIIANSTSNVSKKAYKSWQDKRKIKR